MDGCIKALADETRQQILRLLSERAMCVGELESLPAVRQPTISHHLAVLRQANLVTRHRIGRRAYYQANAECVAECCSQIVDQFEAGPQQ